MTGFILLLLAMAVGTAVGHIEMMTPPVSPCPLALPINSKFDPQTPESQIDFSMTSPLNADGSNYPCKGYNTAANIAALNSVATLEAGSTLTTNFSGTATHGGGSCQFALSYDGGETFAVIHSVMAGCPLATEYEVPIPSDAPTMNKALFAWTWYNKIGNREEYMNCAVVDVKGTSTKAFTAPALFRANTLSDGTCITVEGTEVVFPNPGDSSSHFASVAAGTECVNGSIVASTSSRKLKKVKVKRRAHGRRSLSDWH
ncbi:endoglucanase [Pseudohyphozyma bogoriensis]|nr:endoglucanase [Pseudohyphozyma bogoriensis]